MPDLIFSLPFAIISLAAGEGLEPSLTDPESGLLLPHHPQRAAGTFRTFSSKAPRRRQRGRDGTVSGEAQGDAPADLRAILVGAPRGGDGPPRRSAGVAG